MKTVTLGRHVSTEQMLIQLGFALSWNVPMIRLQLLSSFKSTSLLQRAILRLFDHMSCHQQYLQLHLSDHDDTWILQRARKLGILTHLVIANRSASPTTMLFEILANPYLHTLELNCPVADIGNAIAANPFLRTLILYTYEDDQGKATASLLKTLARRPTSVTCLQLYCTKSATLTIVEDGLVPLCSCCPLENLEITCIQHHEQKPLPFPLSRLEQALRSNQSLRKLGIFHADLTTTQVDQELLSHLHHHSSLSHLDLFGNHIESLLFDQFSKQPQPCALQELHLEQNPCSIRYPNDLLSNLPQFSISPTHSPSLSTSRRMELILFIQLCTKLFQRHPRLYHFGIYPQTLHHHGRRLLYLADANRIGIRHPTLLLMPPSLWPWIMERITQHQTFGLSTKSSCSSPTPAMIPLSPRDSMNKHHKQSTLEVDLCRQRQASLLYHLLQNHPSIWMGYAESI